MDDAQVGARLRAVRIRVGWRQSDVARKAGVSPALVSLVERRHIDRLALGTLRRIAGALEVRVQTIRGE